MVVIGRCLSDSLNHASAEQVGVKLDFVCV
jgi:hypothetical protein